MSGAGLTGSGVPRPTTVPAATPNLDWLNSILPNFNSLKTSAGGVIGSLLNGLPNPSIARNASAAFGVANGLGTGSGIGNRYGYDLYGQQAEKRQQSGIQDLLALISGLSNPALSTSEQQNQVGEFNNSQQMKWQEMLDSLINKTSTPTAPINTTTFRPAGSSSPSSTWNYLYNQPF